MVLSKEGGRLVVGCFFPTDWGDSLDGRLLGVGVGQHAPLLQGPPQLLLEGAGVVVPHPAQPSGQPASPRAAPANPLLPSRAQVEADVAVAALASDVGEAEAAGRVDGLPGDGAGRGRGGAGAQGVDRKSTRLNSSH